MSGLRAINPTGWARPKGYSNAIVGRGLIVMVAGQIGWNAEHQFESDDFIAQLRQALANTVAVLAAAGAKPEHVARMTWYVTDKRLYMPPAARRPNQARPCDSIGKIRCSSTTSSPRTSA